jgi:hypothetical protein
MLSKYVLYRLFSVAFTLSAVAATPGETSKVRLTLTVLPKDTGLPEKVSGIIGLSAVDILGS